MCVLHDGAEALQNLHWQGEAKARVTKLIHRKQWRLGVLLAEFLHLNNNGLIEMAMQSESYAFDLIWTGIWSIIIKLTSSSSSHNGNQLILVNFEERSAVRSMTIKKKKEERKKEVFNKNDNGQLFSLVNEAGIAIITADE